VAFGSRNPTACGFPRILPGRLFKEFLRPPTAEPVGEDPEIFLFEDDGLWTPSELLMLRLLGEVLSGLSCWPGRDTLLLATSLNPATFSATPCLGCPPNPVVSHPKPRSAKPATRFLLLFV